jgi:two-component system cell cycle sensor histidine kinase/response regulator CckA
MHGTSALTYPAEPATSGLTILKPSSARRPVFGSQPAYGFLLEHMNKVVWSGGYDGGFTFIGGGVTILSGFTAAEVLAAPGNIWIDRVHPEDRQRVQQGFQALRQSTTSFDADYRWQQKDGTWIWLHMTAVPRPSGEPRILDGIVTDISRERRLEEEMRQLQKVEAVGQFTGGIAHDFNNLLAVILANNTMLLDALPDDDPRRADALGIQEASERAASLTKQLLAFSRRHAYDPKIVDLNAIVEATEGMLRRLLGEDLELSIALTRGLAGVQAAAGQIEQLVMNLAVNARDAMPGGGKLSIETAMGDAQVKLIVGDTGCGMDADTRHRAFEPFFTTKASGAGTGLGLSTCAGIVKQMGGHIDVDSEPGQGTVVTISLPAIERRQNPAARAASRPPAPSDAGTETILLVEDDDLVRRLVHHTLERLGYRVLDASSGQEALAAVQSCPSPIDLILSDVVMPDLSGTELVRRVQARSATTKAVFMSGHIDHLLLRDGALEAGSHFIQKPFMPQALARKIREVLDAQ